MEQPLPKSLESANKTVRRKWPLFLVVILFMITTLIIGYGLGFVMGQKKISNSYTPDPNISNPAENSKSISGTISNISGNTLSVANVVRSLGTPPEQNNLATFQVEITSDTKITKVVGPIEQGKLSPKTAEIPVGELTIGMNVNIESAEPITSASIKAMSIEAQPGTQNQQTTNTPPAYVPPLMPIDLPNAPQSTGSGTNR